MLLKVEKSVSKLFRSSLKVEETIMTSSRSIKHSLKFISPLHRSITESGPVHYIDRMAYNGIKKTSEFSYLEGCFMLVWSTFFDLPVAAP